MDLPEITQNFSRLRRAKTNAFPLVYTPKSPKFSRLRRAKSMHFRLYKGFSPQKFRACGAQNQCISACIRASIPKIPAAGYLPLHSVHLFSPPQAQFFSDLKAVYKRKCVDFARRRRENFGSEPLFIPPLFQIWAGQGGINTRNSPDTVCSR